MPLPKLPEGALESILKFISDRVEEAGAKGVVLGMSGGLDSSVTSALCKMSLGKERVLGIIMPDSVTKKEDVEDAKELAKDLGINFEEVRIDNILNEFTRSLRSLGKTALANLKARIRMCILYAKANDMGYLVAGTSNKTEILLGYFTKYGDGAADFEPIGDLYKTQVRELARKIGIPEKIIRKRPSAGLYPGQYDEEELGYSYEILDSVLYSYFELGMVEEEISAELKISSEDVRKIISMVQRSYHKRRPPYILKLGLRTPGVDFD